MSEYFRSFIKKDHFGTHPYQPFYTLTSRKEIRFRTNFTNCVLDAMLQREWKETESELDWDVIWADRDWIREVFDYVHLAPHQKVSHFRNHYEVKNQEKLY